MSLSEYEQQRLENIKQNEALLRNLDIPTLIDQKPKTAKSNIKQHKPVKVKEAKLPSRASKRIRGEPPAATKGSLDIDGGEDVDTLKKVKRTIDELDASEQEKVIKMFDKFVPNTIPAVKSEDIKEQGEKNEKELRKEYEKLKIHHEWATVKVTPSRINSCIFHPSNSKLLGIAVDVEGHLGFWDVKAVADEEPVVYNYRPHTSTVTDIHFNPTDDTKLMTSSYDGHIRTFDINKATFDTLEMEEFPVTSFDLSQDGHILWLSTSNGDIAIKDLRAKEEPDFYNIGDKKKVGCVHLNPLHQHLLATACNDRTVSIFDTRKIKKPLHQFEHGYSATSCYWSPNGSELVTTSYDDYIRIFSRQGDLKTAIAHNNHTGRWITNFRAKWSPRDNCVMIGNMKQPIDIYSNKGQHITQLLDPDRITAIQSVNAFHPSVAAILSGNASGRMVVYD